MKVLSAVMALAAVLAAAGCGAKDKEVIKAGERGGPVPEVNSKIPSTEIRVEYWPGGQKKEETEYRGDKKHGKSTLWYNNGQVEWEGEYRDGEPVRYKHWTEDGKLIRTKK